MMMIRFGCFLFYFKSRVSHLLAGSTAWITAYLPPPPCPFSQLLMFFWGHLFHCHLNPGVQTLPLQGCFGGAPCTCRFGPGSFCIPGVQLQQPVLVHQGVQCPRGGFLTSHSGMPSLLPAEGGKALCYRVQAAPVGMLPAWPALLRDDVYIAPLHPGSSQPRAALG